MTSLKVILLGVITEQQALNDKMSNMNNEFNSYKEEQQDFQQKQQDFQQKQQDFQNQNSILPETETDISNNLQFNNSMPEFNNLFNNYFSQLTSLIADLGDYDEKSVMTINLPVPYSSTTIPIRTDMFTSHVPQDILFIIQMVWLFIFGKYYLSFILKVYYYFATGQILDRYSLSGEVITQDML